MLKTLVKLKETSTNAINVKKNGVLEKDSILEDLKVPFSKFILAAKLFKNS
jgi:hypothetical protein